ncbi:unnamed protein product [Nezara viridula]|uniref:Neuropeptide n=1 Tax=Nezara viridula TaxID=85310 RepID=A0A9P0E5E3_NEZVI|nr:unnamed protein product [Nezara viridula]
MLLIYTTLLLSLVDNSILELILKNSKNSWTRYYSSQVINTCYEVCAA